MRKAQSANSGPRRESFQRVCPRCLSLLAL